RRSSELDHGWGVDRVVTATANDVAVLSAALATPYDEKGRVDSGKLGLMVENYISRGVEGMYCCGSSGEGLLLSTDERVEVVRSVAEAAHGRVPVIAHVGALSTREAIELATRSQEAGACAISMVPPSTTTSVRGRSSSTTVPSWMQ